MKKIVCVKVKGQKKHHMECGQRSKKHHMEWSQRSEKQR